MTTLMRIGINTLPKRNKSKKKDNKRRAKITVSSLKKTFLMMLFNNVPIFTIFLF